MDRRSRQVAGLALVGLAAVVVALHDGLTLHEPIVRVVSRADTAWVVLGLALVLAAGLLLIRRHRRRTSASDAATEPATAPSRADPELLTRRTVLPAVLSVAALVAILVGIHAESVHVKPMYDYTVQTGWDGPLNYQERELLELAALGVLGTLAAVRWRRAAYGAIAAGVLVLVYPTRFIVPRFADGTSTVPAFGGSTIETYLGAEPYLLLLGGILLVVAGVVGVRWLPRGAEGSGTTPDSAAAA